MQRHDEAQKLALPISDHAVLNKSSVQASQVTTAEIPSQTSSLPTLHRDSKPLVQCMPTASQQQGAPIHPRVRSKQVHNHIGRCHRACRRIWPGPCWHAFSAPALLVGCARVLQRLPQWPCLHHMTQLPLHSAAGPQRCTTGTLPMARRMASAKPLGLRHGGACGSCLLPAHHVQLRQVQAPGEQGSWDTFSWCHRRL